MIPRLLFYLLLVLLPTQIGRHFFFNFSLVKGLYSDYLMPVLYLTDIIIFFIIITQIIPPKDYRGLKSFSIKKNPRTVLLLSVLCYLLINVLFIASNKWVALYKLVKLAEFILLGLTIWKIKPVFSKVVLFLSIGAFYSSFLAIWQFLLQRSAGGVWWYLGERTFSVTTPGIAAFNWQGNLVLRSYATFPHPNILAGFLVIVICLIFSLFINQKKKINPVLKYWFFSVCVMGFVGLLFTFSRLGWLSLLLGILVAFLYRQNLRIKLKIKENFLLFLFYFYIFLSLTVPLVIYQLFSFVGSSLKERVDLINQSIALISSNPLIGVGLNNSIIRVVGQLPGGFGLYFFQPVHNIYLLVMSETGLVGFFLFIFFISVAINKSLKKSSSYLPIVIVLILLGGYDHYLLTLQQGILMFTVFFSLAFLPKSDLH